MLDKNTPLWQLTAGQFLDLLNSHNETVSTENFVSTPERRLVYGIGGLAKELGCSKPTAAKYINSGYIDDAVIRNGQKIIIEIDKALDMLKNKSKK